MNEAPGSRSCIRPPGASLWCRSLSDVLRSIAQTPSVLTRTGASGRKPFAPYARRLAPEVVTKDVANAVLTGYLDNMSRPIDVSCKHLGEATYRFNTRDEKDGQRFADVVSRVAGKRLTWKELTA